MTSQTPAKQGPEGTHLQAQDRICIHFVETECAVGGTSCGAWHDWFSACDAQDPSAIEEDRDPVEITDFPFAIADCQQKEKCSLYRRALGLG